MFEHLELPAGYQRVPAEQIATVLQQSGQRGAILFFEGDDIVLSDIIASRKVILNGKEQLVYCIGVKINGGAEKFIPIASFRQFPRDAQEILGENAFMRALYDGSDADRFELIKNKHLKVVKLIQGEGIDWQKSNRDTNTFVYKTKKFPVFECV